MRAQKYTGLLFLFMLIISSFALSQTKVEENIYQLIRTGEHKQLSEYFTPTVDITLPNNENTYSKTQAEMVMKDFFTKEPPESFNIRHRGSSDDGSLYCIGAYKSKKNSYRTYILIVKKEGKHLIQQIKFEKE